MASTLTEYLNSQDELVREAAEALPHEFSRCTYSLGPLRQAVYLCSTCPEARGICSACSIACHTDHEQIELFPKRNFRCDCPTTEIVHPCKLHPRSEDINIGNKYGQNFQGHFCRCRRTYDPHKEREAMIQCLACEDWFHESCCNLREKPPPRGETPELTISGAQDDSGDVINDAASEASSSGLPPPLVSADDYESFVCGACVSQNPTLRRWAGVPGIIMVVRDSPEHPWRRLEARLDQPEVDEIRRDDSGSPIRSGVKRPLTPNMAVPVAKRPRPDAGSSPPTAACLAPPQDLIAQRILSNVVTANTGISLGTGDIFLTEGFRDRWCRCSSCWPALEADPHLFKDEETYEPPADPDSTLSLEELGMRALLRLPRDRAIEGIHAFNEMRDDLVKFLRPFAQDGKIVNESDVRSFFANLSEGREKDQGTNGG